MIMSRFICLNPILIQKWRRATINKSKKPGHEIEFWRRIEETTGTSKTSGRKQWEKWGVSTGTISKTTMPLSDQMHVFVLFSHLSWVKLLHVFPYPAILFFLTKNMIHPETEPSRKQFNWSIIQSRKRCNLFIDYSWFKLAQLIKFFFS